MTRPETRGCKDCAAEEVATKRAAPHPGPRCATHHRRVVAERREREHERKVCANFGLKPGDYKRLYEASIDQPENAPCRISAMSVTDANSSRSR